MTEDSSAITIFKNLLRIKWKVGRPASRPCFPLSWPLQSFWGLTHLWLLILLERNTNRTCPGNREKMLFDMWIRQCWQIEWSVRYLLKALTPGEMRPPPPVFSRPAPRICVSAPGIWRPVTLFSESTADKGDSRVPSQATSFFTLPTIHS